VDPWGDGFAAERDVGLGPGIVPFIARGEGTSVSGRPTLIYGQAIIAVKVATTVPPSERGYEGNGLRFQGREARFREF